jgi:hypothetical protein
MARLAARLLAAALLVGVIVVSTAGPAAASCALPRATSAYTFTGTVLSVELQGRVAHVKTDDGRTVIVRGTDATAHNEVTSVDRTYRAGVRYEFHPVNATDPYQDNACTATREISSPTRAAGAAPSASDPGGGSRGSLVGGAVLAVAAATAVGSVLWLLRRRATGAGRPAPGRG